MIMFVIFFIRVVVGYDEKKTDFGVRKLCFRIPALPLTMLCLQLYEPATWKYMCTVLVAPETAGWWTDGTCCCHCYCYCHCLWFGQYHWVMGGMSKYQFPWDKRGLPRTQELITCWDQTLGFSHGDDQVCDKDCYWPHLSQTATVQEILFTIMGGE